MDPIKLSKTLIDIPSLTGEEKEIADFLSGLLEGMGFNIQDQSVSEHRRNVLALTEAPPKILFCTHMDTVPPHIPASEDDRFIFGRGACDAKSSLAAMITAAHELKEEGIDRFGLLFLVGEETDSAGAKRASQTELASKFIIVGEPTDNRLGKGHKGIIIFRVTTEGRSAHSAFPELGDSAVLKLFDVLNILRALDLGSHEIFGRAELNIGRIHGGISANVVPDSAGADISIRSGLPAEEVIRKINDIVGDAAKVLPSTQTDPQLTFTLPGWEQTVLPYGTDIPHLRSLGKPLLLGPGSACLAHSREERVEKRHITIAVFNYKKLVAELLGFRDTSGSLEKSKP